MRKTSKHSLAADPRIDANQRAPRASQNGSVTAEKRTEASAPPRVKWWLYAAGVVAAVILALVIYEPALTGPFILDDSYLPFLLPGVAEQPFKAWIGVRPLLMATFYLNYKLGGTDPFWYHWLNVFIHAINALLAYFIVRKLLERTGEAGWRRECLAIFSGALFLAHPVQTESVAYIASRSEVLSVFLFLAAYAVFLYRRKEAVSIPVSIAVLALFGAAALTKEHTVVLPALLLLTDYWFHPNSGFAAIRRNWKLYLPIVAGAAAGGAYVLMILRHSPSAGFGMKDIKWYEYLFTQFRAVWVYLQLFIFPAGQNVDHDFPISRTIADNGAIVFLAGLVVLCALAWKYRKTFPLASFGFFGFLLLLAPTSSIVPVKDVLVEHRLYLPFVCLLLIPMDFLRRWHTTRAAFAGVLGVTVLAASAMAYQRNELWGSALALWSDAAKKSPHKWRPQFQVAYANFAAGQCWQAVAEYEKVAKLQQPAYDLLLDWALAEDCAGNQNAAVAKLQDAVKLEPTAHAYALIGMEYGKQAKVQDALNALQEAERLDPQFWMTYVYRGNVYASVNELDKAKEQYAKALAIDPANQIARDAMAMVERRSSSPH
jgi:cytochrome c-type biogenesis protein CcmH/NrfG